MDTKSNDDSAGSDSLDKSMQQKCVMVETTTATEAAPVEAEASNCCRDSATLRADGLANKGAAETNPQQRQLQGEQKTDAPDAASSSVGESSTAGAAAQMSSSSGGAGEGDGTTMGTATTASTTAFETKVTQISQNLKETTLAETAANADPVDETAEPHNSTNDAADRRVKKVRFHPDVKEYDGGNRVKKKRRSAQANAGEAADMASTAGCDGMDLDEDHEEEEDSEEEFDLAKTIAEAEDYLKQHPLTFVRRVEQNGERLRDGLLNIEDMPQLANEVSDDNDEDFYKRIKPENGIERVLGKETKAGKVEFLLRYENQGGLIWESEEYIRRMCPTLLKAYEKNRERRQQRLMHHVAKRQTLRQRYTDF